MARCNYFRELWRLQNRRVVHINISELEAFVREEARLGLNHSSVRCGFALDSQVALGALVKGRSSSKSLNTVERCVLTGVEGAGCLALECGGWTLWGYY